MRAMTQASFPTAPDKAALERGEILSPRFDANGLIAAIAQQHRSPVHGRIDRSEMTAKTAA